MKYSVLFCLVIVLLWSCAPNPSKKGENNKATGKRIALTYDDAPRGDGPRFTGAERTNALIRQLQSAKTGPVAFFVTTRGLDKPEGRSRIAAYADAGHLIANHSDKHMWGSRTEAQAYIDDIALAETKLEGFANRRAWFRFPYLDEGGRGDNSEALIKRDAYRAALKERNLMSGYVTVDTFDWHLQRLWQEAARNGAAIDMQALSKIYTAMVLDAADHYDVLSQKILGRRPAHVLLLHENDLAASFTVDLVRALRADGWTIIDPDEAFDDAIANQLPKTRFSGMGRIAALAADKGLTGSDVFDHWSVSETAIDTRVTEAKVFQ